MVLVSLIPHRHIAPIKLKKKKKKSTFLWFLNSNERTSFSGGFEETSAEGAMTALKRKFCSFSFFFGGAGGMGQQFVAESAS